MDEKKLGLGNVVSISVGLVVATSCLVSLGNGAGTLGSLSGRIPSQTECYTGHIHRSRRKR